MSDDLLQLMGVSLRLGDCIEQMRAMPDASVDSIVTDPPYELGFMGKGWDKSGIANSVEMWREALRVLKPGGHLLAFSGTRTYHRMVVAIEDAGFEVRDQIGWTFASGFPKSLDVSKAIDKAAGAEREVVATIPDRWTGKGAVMNRNGRDVENGLATGEPVNITTPATGAARQWQGWGTALKPAWEPICVARKPLIGTVAENVLQHGTGAINIDGCRVRDGSETGGEKPVYRANNRNAVFGEGMGGGAWENTAGRWPANICHDGSDEVLAAFPGEGSAARFFYCAKASKADRNEGLGGFTARTETAHRRTNLDTADNPYLRAKTERLNTHPTVKPTDLMRYLCRLVTPPGGVVLDPFMGSGSTGKAAVLEGFQFVGIDMTAEYVEVARARVLGAIGQP